MSVHLIACARVGCELEVKSRWLIDERRYRVQHGPNPEHCTFVRELESFGPWLDAIHERMGLAASPHINVFMDTQGDFLYARGKTSFGETFPTPSITTVFYDEP